ncbi:hypothetical protein ADK67_27735 [Saccharothrix sp. NRRL B-16348]|nr:hypothetical protein ADK67_27735 [Saccharothrix sp. NRRL B-16348]
MPGHTGLRGSGGHLGMDRGTADMEYLVEDVADSGGNLLSGTSGRLLLSKRCPGSVFRRDLVVTSGRREGGRNASGGDESASGAIQCGGGIVAGQYVSVGALPSGTAVVLPRVAAVPAVRLTEPASSDFQWSGNGQ